MTTASSQPPEWAALMAELRRLPDVEQSAIRLVYTHGVPMVEAAAWLRVGNREMSRLLSSGLRTLGAALIGSGHPGGLLFKPDAIVQRPPGA